MSAVINRVDCNLRYDGLKKQFCANQKWRYKEFFCCNECRYK